MTTATITVTDTLTGRELTATDVESALAERQAAFLPKVPPHIRRRAVPQPTHEHRARQRNAAARLQVEYEHRQHEATGWRDLEWDASAVKHLPPVTVSDEYRANRDVLERLYARDLAAILDGSAPLPDQHPARELAPANLDADAQRRRRALAAAAQREPEPQPLTGAERDATVQRVRTALKRIGGGPEPEPRSWRDYGGIIAGAALGLAAFAALLAGRVVL